MFGLLGKIGWNQRNSFDNIQVLIFHQFGLEMPIHAYKWAFKGI